MTGTTGHQIRFNATAALRLCALVAALVLVPSAASAQDAPDPTDLPNQPAPEATAAAPGGRLPPGVTPETKAAIDKGLAYLARMQSRQGSWANSEGYGAYPVAMTALAGIAMLMDGNTTTQGRYAQQVDRAAKYLLESSGRSGLIERGEGEGRPMFGHGFSMLFLGELYGMTEEPRRQEQIHDVLARAIQLTDRAQSSLGGWIYMPDSGGDEGSVTITQVQGLRSARNAGVTVPKKVIDQAMSYLEKSQNSDGGIRYSLSMGGGGSRPAITAAAVCCWFNAGEYESPLAKKSFEYAKQNVTPGLAIGGHFYYAHMYMAQAMWVSRDAGWERYYRDITDVILAQQGPDGSWEGDGAGKIYGTAAALIVLQLPFNQLPIMQR